jgi:hypothetical protein
MDFNSIGKKIASSTGVSMSVDAPNGNPMFAYEDLKKGWQVTDDPDGVNVAVFPCEFTVVSKDSKEFRRQAAELYRKAKLAKKQKFSEAEREGIETVASAIVGWSHIVWNDNPTDEGSKNYLIEYNQENLMKVLSGYRAALDKTNEFIVQRENFM